MIDNRHAKRNAARATRPARNRPREAQCSRVLMLVLAFVALTIQALVIQSHIHFAQRGGKALSANAIALAADAQDVTYAHPATVPVHKYPFDDDPSNCPLCQAFGHSAQFMASAAVLFSVPYFITISFIVFRESRLALFAVSHSWRGRAPPSN